MFRRFTVHRLSQGLVASVDDDRFALDADAGADAGGAGDSSQLSEQDTHFDDGEGAGDDGADHGDGVRTAAEDADDEDFEDDENQGALPADEQVKKLRAALKKAKRKLGSSRGDRQILKQFKDRGIDLNDLYADSRQLRELRQAAERNPRLKALLAGNDTDEDQTRARARTADRRQPEPDEVEFDESLEALGFDPKESKANRVLADGLKRVAVIERQLKGALDRLGKTGELEERVNRIDRTFSDSRASAIRTEWDTATKAAASKIQKEGHRKAFQDLMIAARERVGGRQPASALVSHYLNLIGVEAGDANRARQAATANGSRNRVAEKVTQLPRQPQTNGSPAPARKSRESLADVHKRIRSLGPR